MQLVKSLFGALSVAVALAAAGPGKKGDKSKAPSAIDFGDACNVQFVSYGKESSISYRTDLGSYEITADKPGAVQQMTVPYAKSGVFGNFAYAYKNKVGFAAKVECTSDQGQIAWDVTGGGTKWTAVPYGPDGNTIQKVQKCKGVPLKQSGISGAAWVGSGSQCAASDYDPQNHLRSFKLPVSSLKTKQKAKQGSHDAAAKAKSTKPTSQCFMEMWATQFFTVSFSGSELVYSSHCTKNCDKKKHIIAFPYKQAQSIGVFSSTDTNSQVPNMIKAHVTCYDKKGKMVSAFTSTSSGDRWTVEKMLLGDVKDSYKAIECNDPSAKHKQDGAQWIGQGDKKCLPLNGQQGEAHQFTLHLK